MQQDNVKEKGIRKKDTSLQTMSNEDVTGPSLASNSGVTAIAAPLESEPQASRSDDSKPSPKTTFAEFANEAPPVATTTITKPHYITELHPADVLLGRGSRIDQYSGNLQFRKHVGQWKQAYASTSNNERKKEIAETIIGAVTNINGRFLRRIPVPSDEATELNIPDHCKNAWVQIDHVAAIEKTKQALREKGSAGKRNSNSNTVQAAVAEIARKEEQGIAIGGGMANSASNGAIGVNGMVAGGGATFNGNTTMATHASLLGNHSNVSPLLVAALQQQRQQQQQQQQQQLDFHQNHHSLSLLGAATATATSSSLASHSNGLHERNFQGNPSSNLSELNLLSRMLNNNATSASSSSSDYSQLQRLHAASSSSSSSSQNNHLGVAGVATHPSSISTLLLLRQQLEQQALQEQLQRERQQHEALLQQQLLQVRQERLEQLLLSQQPSQSHQSSPTTTSHHDFNHNRHASHTAAALLPVMPTSATTRNGSGAASVQDNTSLSSVNLSSLSQDDLIMLARLRQQQQQGAVTAADAAIIGMGSSHFPSDSNRGQNGPPHGRNHGHHDNGRGESV